jgi:hypothetical protein
LIERYGERCYDFTWSIFNEPDLGKLFWRTDWTELQKFYDYSVDGVLRAFEDHGYDSNRVFIGGLELGGIFGVHLKLKEFLVHCSPRAAPVEGALLENAAYADKRLDGKRSRRVEALCRESAGRGSPCDFVSIHAYNTSKLMADKLARAKEMALDVDAEYYADLWVNSHEACPGWDLPPDPAFSDSYLGNGYFETWCADVARRRLACAGADARYANGETILTFWPWPSPNFEGRNDCVRAVHVDDDGDGRGDRVETIAMPVLHYLGLVARMGNQFQVFPETAVGGHVVSGFASPTENGLAILVYSHHALDTQSRSGQTFRVALDLPELADGRYRVSEHRYDKDHHSYFHLATRLVNEQQPAALSSEQAASLEAALADLKTGDAKAQIRALESIAALGRPAASAAGAIFAAVGEHASPEVRAAAMSTFMKLSAAAAFPADEVRRAADLVDPRPTQTTTHEAKGGLTLSVDLSGNGSSVLFVEKAD